MKNKKFLIIIVLIMIVLSGCNKKEDVAALTVYTSVYPTEYILDYLYGDNIAVTSIYPDGTDFKKYDLTKTQLDEYSINDLFVYNSTISKEKNYAVELLNRNKKIKIIDASLGMSYDNDVTETWLNPSSFLMMASNIKEGLKEYINESIEIDKINNNYNDLQLSLTKMDAELKSIVSNSSKKTIVVSSDAFLFLKKYGFDVISIEENANLTDKVLLEVENLLSKKSINYIFLKDNDEESETIKKLKKKYNFSTARLNTLSNLSTQDRLDNKDYESIMYDNINSIKLEVNM